MSSPLIVTSLTTTIEPRADDLIPKVCGRYGKRGVGGLSSQRRRPKFSLAVKILDYHRGRIRELRKRRLGSRKIQSELNRVCDFDLSPRKVGQGRLFLRLPGGCLPRRALFQVAWQSILP